MKRHMQKNFLILIAAAFLVSCAVKESNNAAFSHGTKIAELKHKKLDEVSGLASSINNPGLFWTHNDSGNGADVFLIDQKAEVKRIYTLQGIDNRDWEDICVGPGPDSTKNYVYVGDIGDNDASHLLKYIYRFEEPLETPGEDNVSVTDFDTIAFKLPGDERKDAEALFIDSRTNDLYIITKNEEPVSVYQIKYPYSTKDTITSELVVSIPVTKIVAADLTADGGELLMKNYSHIFYWKNPENKSIPDLLNERPQEVPYEAEPQGEAIAWARDKSGFYTLSERSKGAKSFLYFYKRK